MGSLDWKKVSEQEQKVGYKKVVVKDFIQPNGKQADFTTWYANDTQAAAVIALTEDRRVVIARQYRPGPEMVMEELPGGLVDVNEDFAVAAARELAEETGYVSNEPLEYIGCARQDGYTNMVNHYYLARNCTRQVEQELDDVEFVEVDTITIEQLIDNAKNGKITDAPAVLMAYDELKRSA